MGVPYRRGLDLEQWVRGSFRCFGAKKPKLRVTVEKNGQVVERLVLEFKSFYVVGKLPTCDLQMLHPSISRQHAVLARLLLLIELSHTPTAPTVSCIWNNLMCV